MTAPACLPWLAWLMWPGWLAWAWALARADVRRRVLPDWLTVPGALAAAAVAVAVDRPAACLGGVGWAVLYLVIGRVTGGVGGGDVKLAGSLGTLCALAAGAAGVIAAVGLASGVTLVAAAGAVLHRRLGPGAESRAALRLPHGPGMLAAGVLVCLAGQTVWQT